MITASDTPNNGYAYAIPVYAVSPVLGYERLQVGVTYQWDGNQRVKFFAITHEARELYDGVDPNQLRILINSDGNPVGLHLDDLVTVAASSLHR